MDELLHKIQRFIELMEETKETLDSFVSSEEYTEEKAKEVFSDVTKKLEEEMEKEGLK